LSGGQPAKRIPLDGNLDSNDLSWRAMKVVDLEPIRDHSPLLGIAAVVQVSHCGSGASSTRMIHAADNAHTISPDSAFRLQGGSCRAHGHSSRTDLPALE
jgi:hypothetical protein